MALSREQICDMVSRPLNADGTIAATREEKLEIALSFVKTSVHDSVNDRDAARTVHSIREFLRIQGL